MHRDRDRAQRRPSRHGPGLRQIGVVLNPTGSYWMSVMRGICDAVAGHEGWDIHMYRPDEVAPDQSATFSPFVEAIVARVRSEADVENLCRLKRPVVNVSAILDSAPFPLVSVDNDAVGAMAARYLCSLGLQQFTFYGHLTGFALKRARAFEREILKSGRQFRSLPVDATGHRTSWRQVPEFVRERHACPLGLFAANDDAAATLLGAVRQERLDVPESLAILGADNEELALSRCRPSLSSIEVPTYDIGFMAAELAFRLLSGEANTPRSVLLPPCRVVARKSTDVLAMGDDSVRKAIRFIRDNAHLAVTVNDVMDAVGDTPLRTLQRHFWAATGVTIREYTHSTRLNRIKDLLNSQALSIKEVAYNSGFCNPYGLTKFFRARTGSTPQEYRNKRSQA